mmetsp:Transcript_10994/g.17851  ORF Transcript_10994/g.17851 Transcript_10994/m.17851 type:complete len:365 (+) Transcript_10994:154-1248(+)
MESFLKGLEIKQKWLSILVFTVVSAATIYSSRLRIIHGRKRTQRRLNAVYTIAVTGGPCGGKTTCVQVMKQELTASGYQVFCVPETQQVLTDGGVRYPGTRSDTAVRLYWQQALELQLKMEDTFVRVAESAKLKGKKAVVVLFYQGCMDIKARMPKKAWNQVMAAVGARHELELALRYDLVLHLTTAAAGSLPPSSTKALKNNNRAINSSVVPKNAPHHTIFFTNKKKLQHGPGEGGVMGGNGMNGPLARTISTFFPEADEEGNQGNSKKGGNVEESIELPCPTDATSFRQLRPGLEPQVAKALDDAVRSAWADHPNLQVIGNNYPDFQKKMEAAGTAARGYLAELEGAHGNGRQARGLFVGLF